MTNIENELNILYKKYNDKASICEDYNDKEGFACFECKANTVLEIIEHLRQMNLISS